MPPVPLILVGSHRPLWLLQASRDALDAAETLFVDQETPQPWWQSLALRARRVDVAASDDAREVALRALIEGAQAGSKVARVYWGTSCHDPAVLRDVRQLKDAAIDFDLLPPVESAADSWLSWLHERPLFGRRVAVLRMVGQASETAELLRSRGADPWVVPTIELHPPEEREALGNALRRMSDYDLVAFTSVNGVERTFEELGELGLDARAFGRSGVAAIGDGTARRLADRGIRADVVAKVFRGEALAESILEWLGDARGKRVLVPRAVEAREVLPEMLRQAGAQVDVVPAYRTLPPAPESLQPLVAALEAGRVDAVLLTSSSTVTNLCDALGQGYARLLARTCVASIGPITSARARELGLEVRVEAVTFTIAGVVDALEGHFS